MDTNQHVIPIVYSTTYVPVNYAHMIYFVLGTILSDL